MPRALKSEKFYLHAPGKSGFYRGKRLLGINSSYEGKTDNLTIQDLVDFLKEKEVKLSEVILPSGFITVAMVEMSTKK